MKFPDPGGWVRVTCEVEEETVRVAVADTGCGISRELARGIGGDLTVSSAVGEGSTFVLTLVRADG